MGITVRDLFSAGAHFGQRARFRNPQMSPYIFTVRDKISIIDLEQTQAAFERALAQVRQLATGDAKILMVGTKMAAGKIIREQAQRAGMPYVCNHWPGGMLTNYKTIRASIRKYKDLQKKSRDGSMDKLSKKETLLMRRQMNRLERSLGGIVDMEGLPDALFVIDVNYESIAVTEANKLRIPVIGVVDTNSSPDGIDHLIPGNDDARRAIALYVTAVADAIVAARPRRPKEPEPKLDAAIVRHRRARPPVAPAPATPADAPVPAASPADAADAQMALTTLVGLGAVSAKKLEEQGISGVQQLAGLDEAAVERLDAACELRGKLKDWVTQARDMA